MALKCVAGILFGPALFAQGVITTIAGADWVFPGDGKPAMNAPLGHLSGIAVDPQGNPVIVDPDNCMVFRIQPDGILRTIAGNGMCFGDTGEGGPAISAALFSINSVSFDLSGNLFLTNGYRVRKIIGGVITTVGGSVFGDNADNVPAAVAQFNGAWGSAVDSSGNIYFADYLSHKVRKISAATGIVSTVAGNGVADYSGDGGPGTRASLNEPFAVALDAAGNLYIADTGNDVIRKVTPAGIISTEVRVSGSPQSLVLDRRGVMYIGADNAVYSYSFNGPPVIIAGDPNRREGYSGDGGPATAATFGGGVVVAPGNSGEIYVADGGNQRVRKIDPQGIITTIAGNGRYRYAGEGVPAISAVLNVPGALAFDAAGNLYIAEVGGKRVRKLDAQGTLSTYAGNGGSYSEEGTVATQTGLDASSGIVFDRVGNLYVTSLNSVRKVTPSGETSFYATTAGQGLYSLGLDSRGNLYATDADDRHVWKIDQSGKATLFAGTDQKGFSGDNGPAIQARLDHPRGIAVDAQDNVYIADSYNGRVRKVTPDGVISTFVEHSAASLTFDAAGKLYIGDDAAVFRVTPGGVVTQIGGGGREDQLGDGKLSTEAALAPAALAFDKAGNLYVADSRENHNRVRKILALRPNIDVKEHNLTLSASSGGAPQTRTVTVIGDLPGLEFDVSIDSFNTAGWLTVDAASGATPRLLTVSADPANLPPGTYPAILYISPRAAAPVRIPVAISFAVGPSLPPQLSLDTDSISFTYPQGGTARPATFKVSNIGGGALDFTVSLTPASQWLSVTPVRGNAFPGKPAAVTITASPAGLPVGAYTGSISIQPNAGPSTLIPVAMTISSAASALLLTQTGLSFTAVERGGIVPAQTFGVINLGTGKLPWTASVSVLSGGDWLRVTPSGVSDTSAPVPQAAVAIDASGVPPGRHYGLVRVDAPGAANTPQVVTVFLEVLSAGQDPGAVVRPSELLFTAVPGAGDPGSQVLEIYNISGTPKSFVSSIDSPDVYVNVLPQDGTLDPSQPERVVIQPGYVPGFTTSGRVTFQFSDGRVQEVKITTISAAAPRGSSPGRLEPASAETCAATKLIPALTSLASSFTVSAGWPVGLSADVRDDCGNPHTSGTVTVKFSTGQAAISLHSLKNGTWQATWPTTSGLSGITLTVEAVNDDLKISGSRQITGTLASARDEPAFPPNAVVSAATPVSFQPLAPGSFISIYGTRLADGSQAASDVPLPSLLANTSVIIGGKGAPLSVVSEGQVNALVPFGISVNTRHQVLIKRGLTYSVPVYVDVAPAQPSIFLLDGVTPAITATRGDQAAFLISKSAPARVGDVLTIYCAGLGLTDRTIGDGAAAPLDGLIRTESPVSVSIGGQLAAASFAGLSPGFVGVYQVNVTVPPDVIPGDSVPLSISVSGQSSPAVPVPIR